REDVAALERDAASDPYGKARLLGQHVDASGMSPFDPVALDRWWARCVPPQVEALIVQSEEDRAGGRHRTAVGVKVETWAASDPREAYLLVIDPSSGLPGHDPGEIEVWARRSRTLVCRVNGAILPFALGSAAALLAKRYNQALVDVEAGGWANPVFTA